MSDCLFCKIAVGTIPSRKVHEDDRVVAFHDIAPQAPVHLLIIPRRHVATLDAADADDAPLLAHLLLTARDLALEFGIAGAYRLVTNCGSAAGQSVFHLHLHLLGGRSMTWPPG
jgi:histidine triad (HIT) family protein